MANDYTMNWSNNSLKPSFVLAGGQVDSTTTSLTLTGYGVRNWGEPLQENLIRLMEHFASPSEPPNATLGQLWFDSSVLGLKVCVQAAAPPGIPNATWSIVYSLNTIASVTAPASPDVGQLWFDVTGMVLYHYNGTSWTPFYSSTSLTSETTPVSPDVGQLWYKPSVKRMSIYNGSAWAYIFTGDSISSPSAPTSPVRGTLWFDTTSNVLKIYDNTNTFVPVSNSANIVFDGTNYILNAPLNVNGVVRAHGFLYTKETTFAFAPSQTINFNVGNLYAGTLGANSIVTLQCDYAGHFQLRVQNSAAYTITWANVSGWLGAASAPALATSGQWTFINFFRSAAGLWYGQIAKVGS